MEFCRGIIVWAAVWVLLVTSIACSSSSHSSRGSSDAVTMAVGNSDTAGAIREQPPGSLPDGYERLTLSTYAEVSAVDVVEVVLLVGSGLSTQQRENLAKGIDALLKHIINSNWSIAVADLEATALPTKFITKYKNYADYSQQFAAALGVGKEVEVADDRAEPAPAAEQLPSAQQPLLPAKQPLLPAQQLEKFAPHRTVMLRAFIIVTNKNFSETKLAENKVILAEEANAAPLTRVYAILHTEDGLDDYLNWKNAEGKHTLSRYGSLLTNYKSMLEDFSADIANVLRGVFFVPPVPQQAGSQASDADVAIAQIKVFNAPASEQEETQEGFIHASHYQVKKRRIFTQAQFVEGVCVDITLEK